MREWQNRTALLIGQQGVELLEKSAVAVFGIGGVGGHAAEALARCGIGTLHFIDDDVVALSNLNRQLVATQDAIGQPKVELMRERALQINPLATVEAKQVFYSRENADAFDLGIYDYVVDAIDSVSAKIELICRCQAAGTPIISAMGAGNKLNPAEFEVADIYETSVCPLARVMRHELKKRNVASLKVVYSREIPLVPMTSETVGEEKVPGSRRQIPGSISFVPSVCGLIAAFEVIKDLLGKQASMQEPT